MYFEGGISRPAGQPVLIARRSTSEEASEEAKDQSEYNGEHYRRHNREIDADISARTLVLDIAR
jgi:hypothetical protein